jgi:hypothetical protein
VIFKCLFKKHDYDISGFLIDFPEKTDEKGNLNSYGYLYFKTYRPYLICKRCKREVRWKP